MFFPYECEGEEVHLWQRLLFECLIFCECFSGFVFSDLSLCPISLRVSSVNQ